jgi:phosphatidylserine decarboxylase
VFPLAPEGRIFVIGTAWMAVITLLLGYTGPGAALVALAIALMLVFRAFARQIPAAALGLVAPVDGVVVSVDEAVDPFTRRPAHRVTIRQRGLGEYNLHSPQEGRIVKRVWPGKQTDEPLDPQLAGRLGLAFETDESQTFTLAYDLGRWPRFVRIGAITGNRIGRGKRLGFAGFGHTVTLWVPRQAGISARAGQRVRAGVDLLGELPAQNLSTVEGSKA